ncbi:MAG: hypothetical protein GDA44_07895 [Prochloron sp. SP5CPC1]|nr:hypothetical protein [Candidatus Paraprochloron terpiosi SP5CPC1]
MATKKGLGQDSKLLQPALDSQNNRGASLLEVLAAIVIITTILAIVSPMLFLVAASRVHTRQVEQAMDLARSEIGLIQARMTRGVSVADQGTLLPPKLASEEVFPASAPTSVVDNRSDATTTAAFKVDVDGDDFIVQTFRDAGETFSEGSNDEELAIFDMGVRVYSIAAESNLKGSKGETELASLQFGGGLKDRTTRPLAALYTEISRSDLEFSLEAYEEYLKPTPPTPTP